MRRQEDAPNEDEPNVDVLNVLGVIKGDERYVFLYRDGQESALLGVFGRFASNHELSFAWCDVAILSQRVIKMKELHQ